MSPATADYDAFFRKATGHEPYDYQRALGEASELPALLDVPTGAGKTQALIVSWLYGRRVRNSGPRRLLYALPMRALVEQTEKVAREVHQNLELDEEELSIRTLMGGSDPAELRDWQRWPERDQILIGTIDMLLSRALNRGYAAGRFWWPVAFGLLNNDCRWVFDEVQLMGAARATSAQLDGLRAKLGTALPCETLWASATINRGALLTFDRPQLGEVLSLSEKDCHGPLKQRLEAAKTLEREDLSHCKDVTELGEAAARLALERHIAGTRTVVILNTVAAAQAAYRSIERDGSCRATLLHSRYRPPDRRRQAEEALAEPGPEGAIVIATQVVEAGVDLSSKTLLTESAPFSSIVQRVGRCNREGEHADASVLWLDRGPVVGSKNEAAAAAPYLPADVERARERLTSLLGSSLSPGALMAESIEESDDDPSVLRRRDLLDLFDTSPDLSGMDIDIAPYIRDDEERNVSVLFRELPEAKEKIAELPMPQREELVQVPLASLGKRACWTIDHVEGCWVSRGAYEIPPGATVMLDCAEGGYDPTYGWDGKIKKRVEALKLDRSQAPEGTGEDPISWTQQRATLAEHLKLTAAEAELISEQLDLGEWRETLRIAGALHDVGKAHPVFQATLRAAMGVDAEGDDGTLWAKSDKRGGRHSRPYFRHELASALAVRQLDGLVGLEVRDLVAYLVAAHHGKVRLSIRPAADERRPRDAPARARFALGIVEGDTLPAVETPLGCTPELTLSLAAMELGAADSWSEAAVHLRDDPGIGPFRLGFLEALLRVADWRASDA
ncbi:MAG TPA: CRISPR-associated helicase Cas3' [Solirubrobacteraceae bacterium]|nr:CRISPR-associated helicase Cas3' [Solirubrobacteraceae bacterium]